MKLNWQPISTVPKDGTWVLLCCPHGMYVAGWEDENGNPGNPESIWEWKVDDNKHGPYPLRGAPPTHWMPLPERPKDA